MQKGKYSGREKAGSKARNISPILMGEATWTPGRSNKNISPLSNR